MLLKSNPKIIFPFFIVILLFVFLFLILKRGNNENTPASALDTFAECLRDKGVIMYGADWCPHCQNEKRAFGDSFRLVSYVECPKDPQKCLAAGVSDFPTWLFPDGRKLEGEQGLERLAVESGCLLKK